MTWVVSMKKRNGNYHSFYNYAGHRSAFHNLFQDYRNVMSVELEREISCHFKGLQRKFSKPLSSLQCCKFLRGKWYLREPFMMMSWNLMARAANNTVSICYKHLEWREDALCVYFACGVNLHIFWTNCQPRHVYANLMAAEMCPILPLGKSIITVLHAVDDEDVHLFPRNAEYERFRKLLGRVLKGPQAAAELERRGTIAGDIGTHSMPKGAPTFCSSGSTACPPSVAVHLRAGWSMGGVQDRYLRHDAAVDMFVGRTVSGLPILQTEVAVLPPHFVTRDETVKQAKQICFPSLPEQIEFVAEFALASLIYHIYFYVNNYRLITLFSSLHFWRIAQLQNYSPALGQRHRNLTCSLLVCPHTSQF
ncbi:Hypothetical protein PHPALM_1941 [Phytophthora palmivora]|uniref:Uncharacterized protein n=1 Tax=Phytophthora palmivora TaxID=4796 RepID=A0A2P4YR91_9STRA|nr:Hypothetical protein PHPALM_1941 [Phytophthora palmivora]